MKRFIILNEIKYKTIFFYRSLFRKYSFKIFGGNQRIKKKNSKQPLVTIFTCVKNGVQTLQKTINSVSSQSYKNIEYIIIDGASTDGTLKLIKKNTKYINFWVSEDDSGTSEANNKAISLARGKYIFWLSCDDQINKNFIKIAVNTFKKNNFDFGVGCMKMFSNNPELSLLKKNENNYKEQFNVNKFRETIFTGKGGIPYPAIIFNRSCFEEVGLLNLNYKFVNDYDFLIRLFKKKNPKYFYQSKMIVYRKKGGLVDINFFKSFKEQLKLMRSHQLPYFKFIMFYLPIVIRIIFGKLKKFLLDNKW
jgi:glycosyltransferase involved in cell wall biosynthesis